MRMCTIMLIKGLEKRTNKDPFYFSKMCVHFKEYNLLKIFLVTLL